MSYPAGFLFPPPPPPALSSCPPVMLRAGHEGSAFAPYSASGPRAAYGTEPRAASAIPSFVSPGFEPVSGLDFHPFSPLGPCHPYADSAYRKNATRDATATLKAWLNEHRKNPYPTKGEKIMLAIITKMTLTQVSTWFANARRRLKKENKMTWTPRNRSEDEEEPEEVETERTDEFEPALRPELHQGATAPVSSASWFTSDPASSSDSTPHCSPEPPHSQQTPQPPLLVTTSTTPPLPPPPPSLTPPPPAPDPPKPKLWSLAEIATSDPPTQRTCGPQRTPLHGPMYMSPAFIYHHYSPMPPGLPLNGLYSRLDRDFGLRTFGSEKQDNQLLIPP